MSIVRVVNSNACSYSSFLFTEYVSLYLALSLEGSIVSSKETMIL